MIRFLKKSEEIITRKIEKKKGRKKGRKRGGKEEGRKVSVRKAGSKE